jgi:hypothetical protein
VLQHDIADARQLGITPAEEIEPIPGETVEIGREGEILAFAAGRIDEGGPDLGVGDGTHDGFESRCRK